MHGRNCQLRSDPCVCLASQLVRTTQAIVHIYTYTVHSSKIDLTTITFRVTTLGVAAGINVEAVVRYIYNLVFLSTLVPGCCEGKFEVVTTRQQTGHRHSGRVHSHGLG